MPPDQTLNVVKQNDMFRNVNQSFSWSFAVMYWNKNLSKPATFRLPSGYSAIVPFSSMLNLDFLSPYFQHLHWLTSLLLLASLLLMVILLLLMSIHAVTGIHALAPLSMLLLAFLLLLASLHHDVAE